MGEGGCSGLGRWADAGLFVFSAQVTRIGHRVDEGVSAVYDDP